MVTASPLPASELFCCFFLIVLLRCVVRYAPTSANKPFKPQVLPRVVRPFPWVGDRFERSASSGSLAGKERSVFKRLCQQQEQRHGLEPQQEQEQEAGPAEKRASLHREEPGPALGLGRLASLDALGRRRRADAGEK